MDWLRSIVVIHQNICVTTHLAFVQHDTLINVIMRISATYLQMICGIIARMRSNSSITYIGHATLLIEMDGVRILTDPILRSHVSGFIRRQTPLPTGLSHIDLVLISHLHFDHFDMASLRLIGHNVQIAVPTGAGDYLKRNGFRHVREVNVGDRIQVGKVEVVTTPANHKGRRTPFRPQADCLGYLVHGSDVVYFAGDTDLFPEMNDFPNNLDLALMPVWGWGPTLGTGHMDPKRAAEALTLLQPRFAMPIHWGTFFPFGMRYSHGHLLAEPPHLFAHHARELAPQVEVKIINPGESLRGFMTR